MKQPTYTTSNNNKNIDIQGLHHEFMHVFAEHQLLEMYKDSVVRILNKKILS